MALIEPLDWPDRTLVAVAVSKRVSFGQLRLNLPFANDLEFQKDLLKKVFIFFNVSAKNLSWRHRLDVNAVENREVRADPHQKRVRTQ